MEVSWEDELLPCIREDAFRVAVNSWIRFAKHVGREVFCTDACWVA